MSYVYYNGSVVTLIIKMTTLVVLNQCHILKISHLWKKQINENWEQMFQISRSWNWIFIVSNLPLYFLQLNLQSDKPNEYIHLSLESFKTLTEAML